VDRRVDRKNYIALRSQNASNHPCSNELPRLWTRKYLWAWNKPFLLETKQTDLYWTNNKQDAQLLPSWCQTRKHSLHQDDKLCRTFIARLHIGRSRYISSWFWQAFLVAHISHKYPQTRYYTSPRPLKTRKRRQRGEDSTERANRVKERGLLNWCIGLVQTRPSGRDWSLWKICGKTAEDCIRRAVTGRGRWWEQGSTSST